MIDNLVEITKDQLLGEVQHMQYGKYRFITATCIDNGDGSLQVIYHFDKDLEMKHYRIIVQKDEEVSSISKIYFYAMLVENEMKELFGLNVTDIALDYEGHLLLTDDAPDTPMARQQIVIENRGEKEQ